MDLHREDVARILAVFFVFNLGMTTTFAYLYFVVRTFILPGNLLSGFLCHTGIAWATTLGGYGLRVFASKKD